MRSQVAALRFTLLLAALFSCAACTAPGPETQESAAGACTRGESRPATCGAGENSCDGQEYCRGRPTQWECECDVAPLKNTRVGKACERKADCDDGGRCLRSGSSDLLGGGPASAVCVLSCTDDVDACAGYETPLVCVQTAGQGTAARSDDKAFCFPSCELGPSEQEKCGGRSGFACDSAFENADGMTATEAFCRPLCFTDADCNGETACDLTFGVCTPSGSSGAPLGAECGSEDDECEGLCLSQGGLRYCSQRCVLGGSGQCGDTGFCGVLGSAVSASGDVGFCQQACNCNQDCEHPEAVCVPDSLSEQLTGKSGVCSSAARAPDAGAAQCSPGDAGFGSPDAAVPDSGAGQADAGRL